MSASNSPSLQLRIHNVEHEVAEIRTAQAVQATTQATQGATMAKMETQIQWLRDNMIRLLTMYTLAGGVVSALVQWFLNHR